MSHSLSYEKKTVKRSQQTQKKEQTSLFFELQHFFEEGNNKTGNLFSRISQKLSTTDLLISGNDSEALLLLLSTCCNKKSQIPTKVWQRLEEEIINNIESTRNPKFFKDKNRVKSIQQKFFNSPEIIHCIANFTEQPSPEDILAPFNAMFPITVE